MSDVAKRDTEAVEVGPSAPEFTWNERRERAAFLLAEDELTDAEIAEQCGVTRKTLWTWQRRPEFAEKMHEHVSALEATIVRYGLARRRRRIAKLQAHADRLEALMAARAGSAPEDDEERATGVLAERTLLSNTGSATDYYFDDKLSREYRETVNQIAKETGQLTEKVEVRQETLVRQYVGVCVEDV